MDREPPVSPATFRRTLSHFATGVTVISTLADEGPCGMTANAFSSVSLDPPLVLVCVDRRGRMHDRLLASRSFAVTVLAADQEPVSRRFAGWQECDPFDDTPWRPAPVSATPVIDGGVAFVDCAVAEVHAGGDHSVFIGEVLDLGLLADDAEPLIWFGAAYRRLGTSAREPSQV